MGGGALASPPEPSDEARTSMGDSARSFPFADDSLAFRFDFFAVVFSAAANAARMVPSPALRFTWGRTGFYAVDRRVRRRC